MRIKTNLRHRHEAQSWSRSDVPADRLTSVTDAASNVTIYGYDTENNLVTITDANTHETQFAYDALGRVTSVTFPSDLSEGYSYDAMNNLLSKTDRNGHTINYGYDALYRLTSKSYPNQTGVSYTYDPLSRLTQVSDPSGTYTFTYDNVGRLTGTGTQYSFLSTTLNNSYSYDGASNRISFSNPESQITNYGYDTLNRLTSLADPNTGTFGFGYDADGRRASLTRPNGVNTAYTYDTLSRLLSIEHGGGALPGSTSYTYDAAGNRTSKTAVEEISGNPASVLSQYSYDNIYELTQAVVNGSVAESYTYDAVGNRLTSAGPTSYSNNSSNELTSTSTATYTYDNNGNTLSKTTSAGTTNYTWDFENRLTSVALPGTGGTVTFKYDPFGRRIYKSSTAGTYDYVYDGDNVIQQLNSAGATVADYTQGLGVDEPLSLFSGGATSYLHADGPGSVMSLTGTTGNLAASYVYDSFGNLTTSWGSSNNPFEYTGRELDSEIGLNYYRARYYDPTTGRFLSQDEVGNDEGMNLYVYVGNDPIDSTDPTGFYTLKGFPPDLQNQMNSAITQAIQKVGGTCPSCAGPDSPKIIHALQTASYVYRPSASYCGQTISVRPFRHIDVSGLAFNSSRCCLLASTLTHEASHLGAGTTDADQSGSAYDIEKKCFNCGTGHPPPKAPNSK